jgi:GAG-pre-integrase domain
MKKNYTNYHTWCAKKGNFSLVCEEVNSVSVLIDTWWIDSAATTHISVSMQGCRNYSKPRDGERNIYVADDNKAEVEVIGHFRLLLKTGLYLNLFDTFIVTSFRHNLISISALDKLGFSCSFGDEKFSLYRHSNMVASGFLPVMDNLYALDTIASYKETLNNETRNVRQKLTHQDSAALWHNHLGHISQQRITRLVQSEILRPLNMSDLGPCIECAKGKQTSMHKYTANRITDVLELIHTNICGPFSTTTRNGHVYFISFIDDYSRYGYIYLIKEKTQVLDTFKSFKSEVELQINKMIKDVRSDRGSLQTKKVYIWTQTSISSVVFQISSSNYLNRI